MQTFEKSKVPIVDWQRSFTLTLATFAMVGRDLERLTKPTKCSPTGPDVLAMIVRAVATLRAGAEDTALDGRMRRAGITLLKSKPIANNIQVLRRTVNLKRKIVRSRQSGKVERERLGAKTWDMIQPALLT